MSKRPRQYAAEIFELDECDRKAALANLPDDLRDWVESYVLTPIKIRQCLVNTIASMPDRAAKEFLAKWEGIHGKDDQLRIKCRERWIERRDENKLRLMTIKERLKRS